MTNADGNGFQTGQTRSRSNAQTGSAEAGSGIDREALRRAVKQLSGMSLKPKYPEKYYALGWVEDELVEIVGREARVLARKNS